MAIFEGTVQEFHSHIGPRIRNIINSYARKERRARDGICEHCCEGDKILESAHIHGRGRRDIIELVLKPYMDNGLVRCDLLTVEKSILKEHDPIVDAFKFLCRSCHREYDHKKIAGDVTTSGDKSLVRINTKKVQLYFMPKDLEEFRCGLIKQKTAYGHIYKYDGTFEKIKWNAANFKESSNLKGNIYSGYLRNWRKRGICCAIFSLNKEDLETLRLNENGDVVL